MGIYSAEEQDQMRALRVLVHAEFEEYLESICQQLVNDLERELMNPSRSRPVIVMWAKSAAKDCNQAIQDNHGVGEKYILKMFAPLGFGQADFDSISSTFLERMTTFGRQRGDVAHRSALRAQHALVRQREEKFIDELITYLKDFDSSLVRLRLTSFL